MIDPTYIEAILEWREPREEDDAEGWLAQRGLQAVPMKHGLLVSGDQQAFEAAFGIDLALATLPVRLEVPVELRGVVTSITIPPPRQIRA